ncbi:hypothetical protein Y032_0028g1737 [Ancylostoma ceylanicum]|uniref:Uncharacterized protein n=1 Tax=Ancylostoma ceylanicum TaxID=53326 RepID=A0A016USP8_9BILA|nr:hypothetical protein Y032_0028g1737 [Ancylostoma ceylanicum]
MSSWNEYFETPLTNFARHDVALGNAAHNKLLRSLPSDEYTILRLLFTYFQRCLGSAVTCSFPTVQKVLIRRSSRR